MTEIILKSKPTLKDMQSYVSQVVKARGFGEETVAELFMLLLEECGEMAKAARKTQNIKTDQKSKVFELDHEVADVLMYLLEICNRFDIDLEKAFRDKEEINAKRTWQ
ncbi:MAG: MazG nucleotide pyrophosphohydrolase domain-containing protein [Candidatus Saccharimonadales bacterium]